VSPYKLAVLNTHPIQYFAPLYRALARDPNIDLTVFFCSLQGVHEYTDEGFGTSVRWDVPLLEGYQSVVLPELLGRSQVGGFLSLFNPRIVGALMRGRFDALIIHGHIPATTVLGAIVARLVRTSVFMRCETHLGLSRPSWKRVLRKPLLHSLYAQLCSACLAIGTRNAEFYRSIGVPAERIVHVPYVVDNAFFASRVHELKQDVRGLRRSLGLPTDLPVILFASKLQPRKRAMDLLDAHTALRHQGVESALAIVGSGEDEQCLRDRVARQGLDHVYFFGFQNQTELPRFYAASDIFVLPSENEPWGLVVNEVMAAGLPVVVAGEVGAAVDLVRAGENGYTFSAGDIPALTDALRTMLADPPRLVRMGQRSADLIATWGVEQWVKGVNEALMIGAKRRQPQAEITS
jgi:glycosyltransferase involved in cell wall biosynthesis